jgi:hypothetical protein
MRFLFLLFLLISIPVKAQITASVDRKVINYGENLLLTIDSDNSAGRTPNLTTLKRQFSVIGNVKTGSPYINNGKRKYRTIWKYVLAPKNSGTLNIPVIRVNGEQTKAIKIRVIASRVSKKTKTTPTDTHDILIKATIDKNKVYPGQMLTYTLTINVPKESDAHSFNVTPPFSQGAIIIPLSKPVITQTTQRSKLRTVHSQSFAVFAQQTALYQIEPATINFEPNKTQSKASKFVLKANQLHFEVVKQANQNSLGYWLPSTKLTLSQSWQGKQTVHVGDSVKRIIEIRATSLNAELLPLVSPLSHENLSIKLDDVVVKNIVENDQLIALRQESITITFNKPGTISFEPIQVHWWNTQVEQARITSLSAQNFIVVDIIKEDNLAPQPSPEAKINIIKAKPSLEDKQLKIAPTSVKDVDKNTDKPIQTTKPLINLSKQQLNWLSIIMFLLLVATTLGWLSSVNKKKIR